MKREALAVYPVLDLERAGTGAEALVAAALRGGATMLQLRDKRDSAGAVMRVAKAMRAQLDMAMVPLIINDRLDLALALGAAGVHLGQRDLPVSQARALARAAGRPALLLGISVSTLEQAGAAVAGGADYLSVSPIFSTSTKPDIDPPAGLAGVRAIRAAHRDAGLVGIGGINAARAAEVIGAGADGVAFISAMINPDRTEAVVRAIAARVAEARKLLELERKSP